MNPSAYLLLRLGVGMSMFGHGLVRAPKLAMFSDWMLKGFQKSWLPEFLVLPFSYLIPIAEFIIGILLLLGFFTKQAAFAGGILMIVLIFGSSMQENWGAVPSQLIHITFFALLIQFVSSNKWCVDSTS